MQVAEQSPGPASRRWSRAEYYQMAELGWFNGQRAELIGGEVVVVNPQKHPHASTVDQVAEILRDTFSAGYWVRMQLPLSIAASSEPEPDVAVVSGERAEYTDHPTSAVLVVEVSDTTLQFDRSRKMSLYAQAGIRDYWIVNLIDRVLEVYREPVEDGGQPFGFRYRDVRRLSPDEKVAPLEKPESGIAVAALLP